MKTTAVLLGSIIYFTISIPVSYSQYNKNLNAGSMGVINSNNAGELKNSTSLPDLQCSYFWWMSQNIMEGKDFWVCVRVSNTGMDSADPSHVKIFLSTDNDWDLSDDYYLGLESVDPLSSGDYDSIQWNFNFPDIRNGCYQVWIIAIADCDHEVSESNENNAWKCSSSFTVIDPPDLYVNDNIVDIYEIGNVPDSETSVYSNNKKGLLQASFNTEPAFGLIIPENVKKYCYSDVTNLKSCVTELADSVDWSPFDSPVKNQGYMCQSCWAFAAVALIENLSNLPDLSEQVIVSCAGTSDCSGGWTGEALKYIEEIGVPDEDCYKYMGVNGNCSDKSTDQKYLVKLSEYDYFPKWQEPNDNTVNDLKALLQNGPAIVSMKVPDDNTFTGRPGYKGGVYNYSGGIIENNRMHAVLVVGYNDNGQYFMVKNSWGPVWGENGYFRIAYDDVMDDIKFGGYACTASGVYIKSEGDELIFSNTGGSPLEITNIYSSKNWLNFNPASHDIQNILPGDSITVDCVVNWNNVPDHPDTAIVTINSNDPYASGFELKVIAIPNNINHKPDTVIFTELNEVNFERIDLINDINIYPNPASDFITIRFKSDIANRFTITLIDNAGRMVYLEEFENISSMEVNQIDLSGLADGIYFLRVDYQNGTKTSKIIIN